MSTSPRPYERTPRCVIVLGYGAALLTLTRCDREAPQPAPSAPAADRVGGSDEPIAPLPREAAYDARLAALGEALFTSKVLSEDGQITCASCHEPAFGMGDGKPVPVAVSRPPLATNSTTLYNVRYFAILGWAGRFSSLGEHLDGLIKNPKLMASSWSDLESRLHKDAEWVRRFGELFPDGVTIGNARAALVEYEKSLVTPDAPFDRWLRGDAEALSSDAQQGYALFKSYGCVSCHQGMMVGANLFQRLGVMRSYFDGRSEKEGDLGRYSVTASEEDRHVFRVPSLRNVALTAPYLHDGSAPALKDAIAIMANAQLGIALSDEETSQLRAFLEALTGEYLGQPL